MSYDSADDDARLAQKLLDAGITPEQMLVVRDVVKELLADAYGLSKSPRSPAPSAGDRGQR